MCLLDIYKMKLIITTHSIDLLFISLYPQLSLFYPIQLNYISIT